MLCTSNFHTVAVAPDTLFYHCVTHTNTHAYTLCSREVCKKKNEKKKCIENKQNKMWKVQKCSQQKRKNNALCHKIFINTTSVILSKKKIARS